MPTAVASDWPLSLGSLTPLTPLPRGGGAAAASAVITAMASMRSTLRSEPRTSENMACASACLAPVPSMGERRCLAEPKLLIGRIAAVRIGQTCRPAATLAVAADAHQDLAAQTGRKFEGLLRQA